MKHFNFKELTPSLFDCAKMCETMLCPNNATIGEKVTIGRSKKYTAIFIKHEVNSTDVAYGLLDGLTDVAPEGYYKVIQYVKPIGGYIYSYTTL